MVDFDINLTVNDELFYDKLTRITLALNGKSVTLLHTGLKYGIRAVIFHIFILCEYIYKTETNKQPFEMAKYFM